MSGANPRLAFEMTLIADAVAALAGQPRRIDHRSEALHVVAARAVTPLATNPGLQEGLARKAIRCPALGRLDPARMAEQARGVDRTIQLHFADMRGPGRHVPRLLHRVVVDRRLIEEAIDRKQERAAACVRADVVLQLLRAMKPARPGPIVGQERVSTLTPHLIRNAGRSVLERSFDDVRPCRPARPSHGGGGVAVVNRSMTCRARFVAHKFNLSRPLARRRRLGRQPQQQQRDWRDSSTRPVRHRSRLFHDPVHRGIERGAKDTRA